MVGAKTFKAPQSVRLIAQVMQAIAHEALTMDEIAEATGIAYNSVRGYIKYLRTERRVYIAQWRKPQEGKPHRSEVAAFHAGDTPDVQRVFTPRWERIRASDTARMQHQDNLDLLRKCGPFRDSLVSAFFGSHRAP